MSDSPRERSKRYYAQNREKIRARTRAWYAANRPRALEIRREWRRKNAERKRVTDRRAKGLPDAPYPPTEACECCGRPARLEKTALCFDHDHATGSFRGWICAACNLGLGKLGDTVAGLEKALAYLRRVV